VPKLVRSSRITNHRSLRRRLWLIGGLLIAGLSLVPNLTVHAATLSNASLALADPRPSALGVNYTFTGSNVTTGAPGTIRCIRMIYADTPTGTNVPASMVTNSVGVTLDTTNTNYVPTPGSWTLNKPANGTLTLTNAAGEIPASASTRRVSINGITNSVTADTRLYMRLNTYSNTDCATGPVDSVTALFILTNASTLSLTVDPTLTFSVNAVAAGQTCNGATSTQPSTSTSIPFGTVTTASNGVVCQDLTAASNSANGYTVFARYTAAPTDALAHTIASASGSNAAPAAFSAAGTEAYGYTTNDFTLGTGTAGRFNSNLWAAMTTTNAEVAYEAVGVNSTTYRVGHQVGIGTLTEPGTYTTTVIYTMTPVY
jgi:hypothetical protein